MKSFRILTVAALVCGMTSATWAQGDKAGEGGKRPGKAPGVKVPGVKVPGVDVPGVKIPGGRPGRPGIPGFGGEGGPKLPPGLEGRIPELIKRFDTDGDGKLSDEEKDKLADQAKKLGIRAEDIAKAFERYAMLEKFDKNGDGKLDKDELAAAREDAGAEGNGPKPEGKKGKPSAKQAEFIQKYDKDGDGKLSPAEKAEAAKDTKTQKEEAARQKAERMKEFDANGDGKLDAQERKAYQEAEKKAKANG